MYDDLYEYFLLRRQLILPGIGTFILEKKDAEVDFANRVVHPPNYRVNFVQATTTPTKSFFTWLSEKMNISYSEAIVGFNAFVFDLKTEILSGAKIVWPRMGVFTRGMANEIKVEGLVERFELQTPVPATKVIREKAEHTIRVGEDQRTSTEMEEILHHANNHSRRWWLPALIIGTAAIIAMLIYFSTNGMRSGNSTKISPENNAPISRPLK